MFYTHPNLTLIIKHSYHDVGLLSEHSCNHGHWVRSLSGPPLLVKSSVAGHRFQAELHLFLFAWFKSYGSLSPRNTSNWRPRNTSNFAPQKYFKLVCLFGCCVSPWADTCIQSANTARCPNFGHNVQQE